MVQSGMGEAQAKKQTLKKAKHDMNTSNIVQKLWGSACRIKRGADKHCNGPGLGQSLARSPAREYAGTREKPQLTLCDDGMSCGDYPSTLLRAGSEQLTYLLFGFCVTSHYA